jgi:predicted O-methyltransferase YrrM
MTTPVSRKVREKLIRLAFRIPGYRNIVERVLSRPSEISLSAARFLGELVRRAAPGRPIVEIGTLFGSSTRVLIMFKPVETPLITVDSFRWNPHGLTREQHARITKRLIAEAANQYNVQLCQMDKSDFYASYSAAAPGLVFLDANHSYESTSQDIHWAKKAGAGIICGHDYSNRFPGVIRAVVENGGVAEIVDTLYVMNGSARR